MSKTVLTESRETNSAYDVLVGEDEFENTVLLVELFVANETLVCGASLPSSDLERRAGGKFVGLASNVVDAFPLVTNIEVEVKRCNVVFFDAVET